MTPAILDSRPTGNWWMTMDITPWDDAYWNGPDGNAFAIGALVIVGACVWIWMKGRK